MMKVTPWEVSGNIDYDKLIKEFGTSRINEELLKRVEKHARELHYFLKRKIFFSHRDLNWILDEYEKGNKFFLYTGRAPSKSHTHLGHLIPWIFTKWLQDKFKVDLWFQLPDEEKFLFKENVTLENTKKYTRENMLDILAVGFDQKRLKFLIDTRDAGLMYKEAVKVAKKITFSTTKAAFGFTNETNIGSIFYTAMQAVPAFLPSVIKNKKIPCLIPHAIDQDPHFRVSRDVMPKINQYKPASIHCRFLPALAESGKMSASEEKTIFTTDSEKEVENKIKKYAFSGGQSTLKEHKEKGGNPEIDISYQYLTFFEENDKKLKDIYEDYKSGRLLTGELKEITIEKINSLLKRHQERRRKAEKVVDKFIKD